MSAIATDDGANVAEPDGQPAMPPTSTTMRRMSDAAKIRTRRKPARTEGMLAATEPVDTCLPSVSAFQLEYSSSPVTRHELDKPLRAELDGVHRHALVDSVDRRHGDVARETHRQEAVRLD